MDKLTSVARMRKMKLKAYLGVKWSHASRQSWSHSTDSFYHSMFMRFIQGTLRATTLLDILPFRVMGMSDPFAALLKTLSPLLANGTTQKRLLITDTSQSTFSHWPSTLLGFAGGRGGQLVAQVTETKSWEWICWCNGAARKCDVGVGLRWEMRGSL